MYSIYEIPGIKIGLTSNLKRRTYEMKKAYPDHEMKILYTTDNIKLASMLEQTAQMAFGYPVDPVGYYKYANPETLEKMRKPHNLDQYGEKNPMYGVRPVNAVSCVYLGKEYSSYTEAGLEHNVCRKTIANRLKRDYKKWSKSCN